MKKLIETWIHAQKVSVESDEYEKVAWAVNKLFELAHDDANTLLDIIIKILEIDSSSKVIGALGAGVIEDLLVHHGDDCIDTITFLSKKNKNFEKCLHFTYIDRQDVTEATYNKFRELKDSF